MQASLLEEVFVVLQVKKNPLPKQRILYGRGGETRTRDTRFWRPVLYQLSYAPKVSYHQACLKGRLDVLISGGTDGTRTRDPLRDRQVF